MDWCIICGLDEAQHAGAGHPYRSSEGFRGASHFRGAQFDRSEVAPPSEVYVVIEDRLRITISSNVAGVEVDVQARLLRPDGQITVSSWQFFPTGNRALNIFERDLCEGWLLDVVASTPTAAVRRGNVFADIGLIRGSGATALSVRNLIDAYVTTSVGQGWPDGDQYDSVNQSGIINHLVIGTPAAGADFQLVVPTGARWRLRSIAATLTTAVAAGNRLPVFQITDNIGHPLVQSPFANQQAPSIVQAYCAQQGWTAFTNGNTSVTGLPTDLTLLAGWFIGCTTTGIQAADQWSALQVQFEEWLET